MTSPELLKRWKVTRTLLERAHAGIHPAEVGHPRIAELQSQFTEFIESNELELALNTLEELGALAPCRGGFWRDLERAAATMELHERAIQLHERFLSTKPRNVE